MKTCPIFMQGLLTELASADVDAHPDWYKNLISHTYCLGPECAWWDGEGCAENPLPILVGPTEEQFISQLKSDIDKLLDEKTGWGRVELKKRLMELIDGTGSERTEMYDIHSEKDEDLPF